MARATSPQSNHLIESRSQRILSRALLIATLAVVAMFAFFPIYWMLTTSFTPNKSVFAFPPRLFPAEPTFEHYLNFLQNPTLLKYLGNSFIVATATALSSVLISAYAAYSFSKFRYRGRRSLMFLVLSAQMFPQSLLLISLYLMFSDMGLLQSYWALILSFTTFTLPLCIWMLKGYFDKIPTELIEAARVDGASNLTILNRIILPLIAPALVSTALFSFIRGWNDFIYALTLAGPEKMTLPPGLAMTYIGEFNAAWADMMAASLIVSLPVIILFVVMQRYIISGLVGGAVKG
jgi:multiple sugar transport system permease protein